MPDWDSQCRDNQLRLVLFFVCEAMASKCEAWLSTRRARACLLGHALSPILCFEVCAKPFHTDSFHRTGQGREIGANTVFHDARKLCCYSHYNNPSTAQ